MTPPTATATRRSSAAAADPVAHRPARPVEATPRRPPLRIVEQAPRHRRPAPSPVRRRRVASFVSLALVIGSLLAVVIGHAVLAEGQVRLSTVQAGVAAAQVANRQETLAVAELETPSRIVAEAKQRLHMVEPGQVDQLPYVSLKAPLPTPAVGPAPPPTAPPTAPSTTTTATTTTATTTTATTTTATTTTATTTTATTTTATATGQ